MKVQLRAERVYKRHEVLKFLPRTAEHGIFYTKLHPIIKRKAVLKRVLGYFSLSGSSDATLRDIQDSSDRDVIIRVFDSRQIRQDVLYLSPLIEVYPADYTVRNTVHHQLLLESTRLGVRPVQYSKIPEVISQALLARPDVICDKISFFVSALKSSETDLCAFAAVRPELLLFSAVIMAYNSVCGVENGRVRPVVLLELYDLCPWKMLLEAQDIRNVGASEFIDGLVVITYDAEIFSLF